MPPETSDETRETVPSDTSAGQTQDAGSSALISAFEDWHYVPHKVGLEGRLSPIAEQPADPNGPPAYHRADTEVEAFSITDLHVRSVSARGHSHRYEGSCRQDAMSHTVKNGWVGLAVADGLGSERLSHIGAHIAVHTAMSGIHVLADCITSQFSCAPIADAIRKAAACNEPEYAPSDFRTTLTFAAVQVRPDRSHERVAVVAKIGDSEPWLLRDGSLESIFPPPEESALASSGVHPLPDSDVASVAHLRLRPGDQLFLATDGVGELLENDNAYRRSLLELLTPKAPQASSLLAVVDAPVKGYHDDRTLVTIRIDEAS